MASFPDDPDLIRRIVALDQTALGVLIARYHVRVFRFVTRLVRNEAIAEEITNEVFLDAWRNAKGFEGRATASTWLISIAHNKAVSTLRRRREESWNEEAAGEIADTDDNPEVAAQKTDKGAGIRAAMQKLSPEHREIIDLTYYQEMSITEIATTLAIPEATVKTRMFYARKRLGEILKVAGIDRGWP